MTSATLNVPSVADVLRGDRLCRPRSDLAVSFGLRAEISDLLFSIAPAGRLEAPVLVRSSDFRSPEVAEAPAGSVLHRLRGFLVTELLRLLVVNSPIEDPFRDAVAAWKSANGSHPMLDVFNALDSEEQARLATDVTSHAVALSSRLGYVNPAWRPRTAVSSVARLAGGSLILKDHFDLVVGSVRTFNASVALLDFTTSALSDHHERILRYHALVQTVVSGVVPLRVVSFSSATTEISSHEVTDDLLRHALDDLKGIIQRKLIEA